MKQHWLAGRFKLDLSTPLVMGIVNVTPDSFSDGGRHEQLTAAMGHCEQLLRDGAHILDIGGESSRPGAKTLSADEEWHRIGELIKHAVLLKVPVSIDTYKPETMRRALDAGADIINDIKALREPGAMEVVIAHPDCGICLMHMQGTPQSMQDAPLYQAPVVEVVDFLHQRSMALIEQGVNRSRITLDPGYGFGKSAAHNLKLLQHQNDLAALGFPLLVGLSRKSVIGHVTGREVGQRTAGSIAAALAAIERGASIVRVHDVAETVDAINVWQAAGFGRQSFFDAKMAENAIHNKH